MTTNKKVQKVSIVSNILPWSQHANFWASLKLDVSFRRPNKESCLNLTQKCSSELQWNNRDYQWFCTYSTSNSMIIIISYPCLLIIWSSANSIVLQDMETLNWFELLLIDQSTIYHQPAPSAYMTQYSTELLMASNQPKVTMTKVLTIQFLVITRTIWVPSNLKKVLWERLL